MNTQEIAAAVEAYAQAGTGQKGSQTVQTRQVIAALKAIGLDRSTFSASTSIKNGVYGTALGSIKTRTAMAIVIANADTLVACGLRVIIYSGNNAFVGTCDHTQTPGITRI